LSDVRSVRIFFKEGGDVGYGHINRDPLFSVIIDETRITLRWVSGSHAIFYMSEIAGYYIDKKGSP
jgi:hypothetical protein